MGRFALALALLAAADLAVRRLIPAPDYEANYTMPYNGLAHLRGLVRHVRAQREAGRRVVVFLGDSSARSRIPAGTPNLPEIYASILKSDPACKGHDVAVYNFSVAGLDAASKYFIVQALADRVDAVIFNVNFRGFAARPKRAVPYPELWFELKPGLTADDRAHLLSPPGAGELSRIGLVENALEEGLGEVSALWGRRIELKDLALQWWHPRQWLARAIAADAVVRGGPAGRPRTVWDGPLAGFPADLRRKWLGSYADACRGDSVAAGPGSADVYFLSRLYALARTSRAVLVGYASPYSRWLNARSRFLDERIYAGVAASVRKIPRDPERTLFIDYNDPATAFDPVPGDRYSQAFEHWTHDGLRLFAARLHRDTRGLVIGALR